MDHHTKSKTLRNGQDDSLNHILSGIGKDTQLTEVVTNRNRLAEDRTLAVRMELQDRTITISAVLKVIYRAKLFTLAKNNMDKNIFYLLI